MSPLSIAGRAVAVVLTVGAGVLAWRAGGGADNPAAPPRASDASSSSAEGASGAAIPKQSGARTAEATGDTYEVTLRLTSAVKDARVDAPGLAAAQGVLRSHWRKLKPPFTALSGQGARLVSTIGLRTSASEVQWSRQLSGGKTWVPDARIWNMNEGSFDQREAIVVPAPSTTAFRIVVPRGGRLSFGQGTLNATREATVFVVTVVDTKGATHEVHRARVPPTAARRWTDETVDLGAFVGQEIELRLTTDIDPATPEEKEAEKQAKRAAARSHPKGEDAPKADGGAPAQEEDPLAYPSTPVALWGNPTVLAKTTPHLRYNVLWIVVDALRPDVIASFHDDAEDLAKLAAKRPPLEALLPKVPGLMPSMDALAKRGVRFTSAYSGASWTRPGTLAMLAGARSTELGIDAERWVLTPNEVSRFYASDPPLLPLLVRRQGGQVNAFVNNYFLVGYAPIGIDMGFERVDDHRYRTRDTLEITQDTTKWIGAHKDERFFLFVNYNSPHDPLEPPQRFVDRIPPPPAGPQERVIRLYMAEAAKDDEAIGVLMDTLDQTGLRDKTIVVVTSDHGETMSSAHDGVSGLEKIPIRFHHAASNFEETTHVPILISAPGLLPEDKEVKERVRSMDIAPTLCELLGIELHPRMSGKSMVGLARGEKEADERVVISEGRGTRGVIHGRYRLLVREGAAQTTIIGDRTVTAHEELYDLVDDPGERHDLANAKPDVVAEMHARLEAALKNVPVAGSSAAARAGGSASTDPALPPTIHIRFVGGERTRRVSGVLRVGDAKGKPKRLDVQPVELGKDAFRIDGAKVDIAFATSPDAAVGFDVVVDPPNIPVAWELWLDDKPWPDGAVYAGPYGLVAPLLEHGLVSDETRAVASASLLPPIDPRRDVGLFVARERLRAGDGHEARETTDEGAEEMARLLQEWGYAHGSGGGKGQKK